MKKALLLLLFAMPFLVSGQTKPEALLSKIKAKYEQSSSIMISFDLIVSSGETQDDNYTGILKQEGESYRLESDLQTVISDGKTAWIFLPSNEEVQIVNATDETGAMSPSALLKQFNEEEFQMRSTKEGNHTILELVPIDTEEDIFKIKIKVNEATSTVSEMMAYERNGSRYTMKINEQRFDIELDSELFEFRETDFPNAYIEDLRID